MRSALGIVANIYPDVRIRRERISMSFLRPRIALLVGAVLMLFPALVQAQETMGRIMGRVTDMGTKQPLAGITVILQGQQGEDAS